MPDVILVPPGGGEIVGDSAERRVEILSAGEAINATWSRFGPRREGADLHVHRRHTDLFYVLEGELTVRLGIDDRAVAVPAARLARVPALVVHGFRNGSDEDVRYLNFHAPGERFVDYLRAARDGRLFSYDQYDPPPDGGRAATDAVVGGEELVVDEPGLCVKLHADVDEIALAETWSDGACVSERGHVHHRHVESVYVLEGELTLTSGGSEVTAEAGSWVQVPAGVPHALAAPRTPVRFLELHTPSCGFGAFVRLRAGHADIRDAAAQAAFDEALA